MRRVIIILTYLLIAAQLYLFFWLLFFNSGFDTLEVGAYALVHKGLMIIHPVIILLFGATLLFAEYLKRKKEILLNCFITAGLFVGLGTVYSYILGVLILVFAFFVFFRYK